MLYVALCWVYTIHVCVYSIGQSLNGCKKYVTRFGMHHLALKMLKKQTKQHWLIIIVPKQADICWMIFECNHIWFNPLISH